MKKFLIHLFIFLILITPAISFSADLVPCDGTTSKPCDYNQFITLLNNIITFILKLTIPICAIMFAYAGFLLVTAGGEAAHARTKAKSVFLNALIGLVIAFSAWLIVRLVLTTLGFQYTDKFLK